MSLAYVEHIPGMADNWKWQKEPRLGQGRDGMF